MAARQRGNLPFPSPATGRRESQQS